MHFANQQEYLTFLRSKPGVLVKRSEVPEEMRGKYYKLIDAENSARTFNLPHLLANGKADYKFYTMYPHEEYVSFVDDEIFVRTLKNDCHVKIDYTPEREKAIQACGARYEITMCKSCGGRRKMIDVWLVEVVE